MKQKFIDNLALVRRRIAIACQRVGRQIDEIQIVAVTKNYPASVIEIATAEELRNIGENRIKEAEDKFASITKTATYHLIGHLQSNKAKKAVALFDVIQSVDSLKLARIIDREAEKLNRIMECYLQVNCSHEEQKFGANPQDCLEILKEILALKNLNLTGLMTMGPFTDNEKEIRESFKLCHKLFKESKALIGDSFCNLSMGMSGDFEIAIEEGSTMIRIGSALFAS